MRVPPEPRLRPPTRRRNVVIVAVIVALIVLLLVVQGLAGFYANFLWFHWNGLGSVWSQVTVTKIVLAVVFIAIAWALLWVSLFIVDTVAPRAMFLAGDNELVRRYQETVRPYAFLLRTVVSLVIALILGAGASGQWQHWILFEHALPFGRLDPFFHRDVSFFVFRLPFLSFIVDWIFVALLVTLIVTAIAYFLNGAFQFRRGVRVEPRAIAHISLILALMVLERAWAYYYVDRYDLDLSSSGVVHGASYTDVHVRLAALTLLAVVSLVAFVMFSVNIYRRSLALPAITFGLWAFLALVVGVIYPAIFQVLRVTPAQSTLELPYIKDNIAATRYAMGIGDVTRHTFPANEDLTPTVLDPVPEDALGRVVVGSGGRRVDLPEAAGHQELLPAQLARRRPLRDRREDDPRRRRRARPQPDRARPAELGEHAPAVHARLRRHRRRRQRRELEQPPELPSRQHPGELEVEGAGAQQSRRLLRAR